MVRCAKTSYVITYGYDALGRQTSVTDPLTNTVYTAYDSEGRVVSQRGATYPVDYAYDEFGEKISMTTYRDINAAGDTTRWLRDRPVFRVFCVFRGYTTRGASAADLV